MKPSIDKMSFAGFLESIEVWRIAIAVCAGLVISAHIAHSPNARPFYGDPSVQSLVTLSLLQDWDFDLRNQKEEFDPTDQVALGNDGEWYPLHEPLLPILAVPFYALFGIAGCVILNMIVACIAALCIFNICAEIANKPIAAAIATMLTVLSCPYLTYAYSFSSDLLGATLFIAAMMFFGHLTPRSWFVAGLCSGALLTARMPFAVIVLGLLTAGVVQKVCAKDSRNAPKIHEMRQLSPCSLVTAWAACRD